MKQKKNVKYTIEGVYGLIHVNKCGEWFHANGNYRFPATIFEDINELKQIQKKIRKWARTVGISKKPLMKLIAVKEIELKDE